MRSKHFWFAAERLGFLGIAKQYKQGMQDWLQIQITMVWLRGTHITREFVIHQIAVMTCVITLVLSAILIEVAFIFCLPLSLQTKMTMLFLTAGVNFSIALGLLGYCLKEERWIQQAQKYLKKVV